MVVLIGLFLLAADCMNPSRLLETRRVGTLGHLAKFLLPRLAPTICKLIVQMPIIHDAPWESNVGGVVKSGRHFEGELMF